MKKEIQARFLIPYASLCCNLLYDLLYAPLGIVATAWRGKEVAALSATEVEAELVGEAAKDGDLARFAAFVGDANFEFGKGDVLFSHAAEGTDTTAGMASEHARSNEKLIR